MLDESLVLPHFPDGHPGLCRRVMTGQLADADATAADIEAFWAGIGPWAVARGIDVGSRLKWPWDTEG
jgi:hypothetical protein